MESRLKTAALTSISALLLAAGPLQADQIDIRIGSSHAEATLPIQVMKNFFMKTVADRVAAETGHTINWIEAWNGSVCKTGECGAALRDGLLDIGDIMTIYEPKMIQYGIVWGYVPFASGDPKVVADAMQKIIDDVPAYKGYAREQNNWEFITFAPQADYGMITTFTWDTLADLAGHKIAGGSSALEVIRGSGATPVSASYPEAYTAMQTGVYEGWYLPATAITPVHLEEVSKQYTILGAGASAASQFFANLDFWNGLPDEVKAIIAEVAPQYTDEATKAMQQLATDSIAQMEAKGVRIHTLAEEERVKWANNLPNVPKLMKDEINAKGQPGEVIDGYIQAMKDIGYVFPRDWSLELN